MTNKQILDRYQVGDIVQSAQVLASLKRKGLIQDYSQWRHIEGDDPPVPISYMGHLFRTRYLDGCFYPFLQLVSKAGDSEQKSNPRMCVWGAIV